MVRHGHNRALPNTTGSPTEDPAVVLLRTTGMTRARTLLTALASLGLLTACTSGSTGTVTGLVHVYGGPTDPTIQRAVRPQTQRLDLAAVGGRL